MEILFASDGPFVDVSSFSYLIRILTQQLKTLNVSTTLSQIGIALIN